MNIVTIHYIMCKACTFVVTAAAFITLGFVTTQHYFSLSLVHLISILFLSQSFSFDL